MLSQIIVRTAQPFFEHKKIDYDIIDCSTLRVDLVYNGIVGHLFVIDADYQPIEILQIRCVATCPSGLVDGSEGRDKIVEEFAGIPWELKFVDVDDSVFCEYRITWPVTPSVGSEDFEELFDFAVNAAFRRIFPAALKAGWAAGYEAPPPLGAWVNLSDEVKDGLNEIVNGEESCQDQEADEGLND